MSNKYKLTDNVRKIKVPYSSEFILVHQIVALKDFGDIKKGDLGGWIQTEDNLSQEGNCWVKDLAYVFENAKVLDNAVVSNFAIIRESCVIRDNAKVKGFALIKGCASVQDNAIVENDATVKDLAIIKDNAVVRGEATISNEAVIRDNAIITNCAVIKDHAVVRGRAEVSNNAKVSGGAFVSDNAKISGDAVIMDRVKILLNACIGGHACITDNAKIGIDAVVNCNNDFYYIDEDYIHGDSGITFYKTKDNCGIRVVHNCSYCPLTKFMEKLENEENEDIYIENINRYYSLIDIIKKYFSGVIFKTELIEELKKLKDSPRKYLRVEDYYNQSAQSILKEDNNEDKPILEIDENTLTKNIKQAAFAIYNVENKKILNVFMTMDEAVKCLNLYKNAVIRKVNLDIILKQ